TKYKHVGIILNKVKGNIDNILKRLEDLKLPLLVSIPEDEIITQFDITGKPLIDIPVNSPSVLVINKLVELILNF
ncbi:MAG: hypothetical protein ACFE8N_12050, partial [Promethearchaeota archaeon]